MLLLKGTKGLLRSLQLNLVSHCFAKFFRHNTVDIFRMEHPSKITKILLQLQLRLLHLQLVDHFKPKNCLPNCRL